MLAIIFGLTYTLGAPLQAWLEATRRGRAAGSSDSGAGAGPGLAVGAGGAAASSAAPAPCLTFIPILVIFFAAMAVLEDVGYMARAAYVMDRFMHPMGLHGKSFLPLFLGFGCNVPAVQGARIIEDRRARLLTIMLAPLVPCTGRMAVVAFIAPLFFGAAAALVSWGLIMRQPAGARRWWDSSWARPLARGEPLAFIMELPLYHKPHLRSMAVLVWQRCLSFVRARRHAHPGRLGRWCGRWVGCPTVISETSLLAMAGRALAPLGAAMGLSWQAMVALLTSFVAKENAVATLSVLVGAAGRAGWRRPCRRC